MRTTTLTLIAALAAAPAWGQCGPGGCGPAFAPTQAPVYLPMPQPVPPAVRIDTAPPPPSYRWEAAHNAAQYDLYLGTTHLGAWRVRTQDYVPRSGPSYGPPCPPPVEPPAEAKRGAVPPVGQLPAYATQGVQRERIAPVERYTLSGQETTREGVFQAIETADVPDDSGHLRGLILDPDPQRRAQKLHEAREASVGLPVTWTAEAPGHWRARGHSVEGGQGVLLISNAGQVVDSAPGYWPTVDDLKAGLKGGRLWRSALTELPYWIAGGAAVLVLFVGFLAAAGALVAVGLSRRGEG